MIGIIGAMRIEVETIRSRMEQTQKRIIGGMEFVSGTLRGKPVVTLVCGVGKVSAAMGAQAMILAYAPDCIINSGVGGSLHPDLRIGDLAVAEQLVQHDMDTTPLGDPPGYLYGPDCVYLKTDPAVTAALEAAAAAVSDVRCLRGTIASGDQFIADPEKKRRITETFSDVIACEMEGAAAAVVCIKYEIPFVVIRALSDKADGNAHESYENFGDEAANNSSRIVIKMLGNI